MRALDHETTKPASTTGAVGTIVTRYRHALLPPAGRTAAGSPHRPPLLRSRRTLLGLLLVSPLASLVSLEQAHAQEVPDPDVPEPADPLPFPAETPETEFAQTATPPMLVPAWPSLDTGEVPFRAWHFAEGNSRNGFETYFTLLNLADEPASVSAQYNRDDGIRLTQWLGIEPHARLSLNANDVVGAKAFGASFFADQDIVVERTTIWGPGQNGETMVGFAPDGKRTWHFAEGTTRGKVTTYFVTQNLTDAPASITALFTRDDGSTEQRQFDVPPRGRDAYRVNDLLQDTAFAATFRADQDIVVERTIMIEGERPPTPRRSRDEDDGPKVLANGQTDEGSAMLRNSTGIFGGLGYVGSATDLGSRSWELAEGSTRGPYTTTFVLFNPNDHDTYVRFTFRPEHGDTRTKAVHLPPVSRLVFDPRDVVPTADFATSISSDFPIVVERVYASSGDGLYGALGHTSAAPRKDSHVWYFAEGNTASQIEMFFILYNFSDRPAQVRSTYFLEDATTREQTHPLPAGARLAVRANDVVAGGLFATRFMADQNIAVERTLYLPGGSGFTTVGAGAVRTT
ncbi:MAG TPA: hypothetical protein VFH48_22295 [Chloroflexota bacterium]|nr:hypothetical protein [Chloroflexota bacterium]